MKMTAPLAPSALLLACGLLACGDSNRAAPPLAVVPAGHTCSAGGVLYVLDGQNARAEAEGGAWRLRVPVPKGRMVAFTDRPDRRAARLDVAAFVERWRANGFAAVPPNVAISGEAKDGAEIDVVAEMTEPAWNAKTREFSALFAPLENRALPVQFDQVSLLIDDAQSTIQISLENLTSIPLSIQSITPDPSTWDTSGGAIQPMIGYDFGLTSPNGVALELAFTDLGGDLTGGAGATAGIVLEGDYDNQWLLDFQWDSQGNPSATLTQLSGTNLAPQGVPPVEIGVPVSLINLSPETGPAAIFQVLFNDGTTSSSFGRAASRLEGSRQGSYRP